MIPVVVGAAVLALGERPPVARRQDRLIDLSLAAILVVGAIQLVPLPAVVRGRLSPAAVALDRILRLEAPEQLAAQARPLSIDPGLTLLVLALSVSLVLLFWSARSILSRRGVRTVARGVAWLGLALSAVAIVQHRTAPSLIYWHWRPAGRAPMPFGPFLNRNHLATWLIMAVPLTVGYFIARIHARRRSDDGPVDIESALDSTELWLGASILLMTAALLVSVSRSGITSLAITMLAFVTLARRRMARQGVAWLVAGLALLVVLAMTYASVGALEGRVNELMSAGLGGRRDIWRDTWNMVRDFWLTGVGIGAYERGMLVYQQGSRFFYYNHADNEYLQVAAEGGLLLAVPVAVLCLAGLWRVIGRLRADHSAAFWIRAGAATGLAAAALQSMWENGLRSPANGVLFAIIAAVALHDRDPHSRHSD